MSTARVLSMPRCRQHAGGQPQVDEACRNRPSSSRTHAELRELHVVAGMDGCPVPLAVLGEQADQVLLLTNAAAR